MLIVNRKIEQGQNIAPDGFNTLPTLKDTIRKTLVTSPGIESKALKAYRLVTATLGNLIIESFWNFCGILVLNSAVTFVLCPE
jgi:hypothetical protein